MSIDKSSDKNINNNSSNPYVKYFNDNWDMIFSTINNAIYLWNEFWKIRNEEYIVNPYPIGTYMYAYFEVYIRPLFRNQKK
jgi:hypothetical protein